MAKQRKTVHASLDSLREANADERNKARRLEAQLEAAKLEVERASRAVADAYALEGDKLAAQRRKELQEAEAEVVDLQHRVDAAGLRVQRTQGTADQFLQERARDLLAEREQPARTVALELCRAVVEVLNLHRAYVTERQTVDQLVAAVPGATPRTDGPLPEHPWEAALKTLERAYQQTPELEPPLPRWAGLDYRKQQDDVGRYIKLRRRKRLTEDEQAELDRLSQDRTVTPPVATPRNEVA